MKDIFDRLERTIRSIFVDDKHSWDPDLQDAWQELNQYLDKESQFNAEFDGKKREESRQQDRYQARSGSLAKDYKNLELSPGASFEEVKKSYKRLLALYHPDRHSSDPEKQRLATEISARLNQSYDRLRERLGGN